jgi:P4 family phage/plasmid primase-like protien
MTPNETYSSLTDFLIKHNAKDNLAKKSTHNRIPGNQIRAGSYVIDESERETFYKLYLEHVFTNKKLEYLTERQIEDGTSANSGPLLVDLDFRFDYAIDKRQYDKQFIEDIINSLYLDELCKMFKFTEDETEFNVYVMEKPQVNRVADKNVTKDGIHIIFGLQMDHTLQMMLRERVVTRFPDYHDLPLTNENMESVFDIGISQGSVGWQLYGSRKPDNEAYRLTGHYKVNYDAEQSSLVMSELPATAFNVMRDFHKISAQYEGNPKYEISSRIEQEYHAKRSSVSNKKKCTYKARSTINKTNILNEEDEAEDSNEIMLEDIMDYDSLTKAMTQILESLKRTSTASDYAIIEAHEFAQILPAKYYEPGSHGLNTQVAFALKHTSNKLFLSWVMLRSNASDFDYASIPTLFGRWKGFNQNISSGVTKRTLLYWAKQDANEEYVRVKNKTINNFIEETLTRPNEYDFAYVLSQMFKDRYVCTGVKSRTWYMFKNHRWVLDEGNTLRNLISKDMYDLYQSKSLEIQEETCKLDSKENEEEYNKLIKKINAISTISLKFKKTTDKNNIMVEAAEIFWDGEFIKNMDANRYLVCFTNCVVDIKNKEVRPGYPSDYITKCTGIPYIPKIEANPTLCSIKEQVVTFMHQLFPIAELNEYMWNHLASSLIGENVNQYFNIYRGSGSNGKSLLVDLMSIVLGELKGILPINVITDSRGKVGGTCSELIQLKGCRYAVMQEPKKDMTLNEGIMKEITGEKYMQGRELFQKSETFAIQFQPVVCTNSLFRVESNDDGTWRRMKIVDFMSKFADEGEEHTDDTKFVFIKDKGLKDKLPEWAPVFASMLVSIAFETQGIVKDCDMVVASTVKYRHGQDHISAFVKDRIVKFVGRSLRKTGVWEDFKLWMQQNQGGCKIPKGTDLYEYMDKKFGKYKSNQGWSNIDFVEKKENDDDILEEIC